MQAIWKYVVFRNEAGGEEIATFPTTMLHAGYVEARGLDYEQLISAGFVSEQGACYGASTSLSLPSRPRRDTALLRGGENE